MKTLTKKAKDEAQNAMDVLLAQYQSDRHTINTMSMTGPEHAILICLDNCIELLKEQLHNEMRPPRCEYDSVTGEYGE